MNVETDEPSPRRSSNFMSQSRDRYYNATESHDTKPSVAQYNINYTPVDRNSGSFSFDRPHTESRKRSEEQRIPANDKKFAYPEKVKFHM
jgi:hypothetical protein